MVEQTLNELLRCNLTDVITSMESFYKLWNKGVFTQSMSIQKLYSNCDMYLSEYLGKSKKDITGS